jgi:hypothetical protein
MKTRNSNSISSSIRRSTQEAIRTHGHAVIGVLDSPAFSYTIGLTPQFDMELIVMALPPPIACAILNDVARALRSGADFALGVPDDRFANLPVMFAECGDAAREYVVQADAFYGREVRVVQMVLSDRNGVLPSQPGFEAEYMRPRQRLLFGA